MINEKSQIRDRGRDEDEGEVIGIKICHRLVRSYEDSRGGRMQCIMMLSCPRSSLETNEGKDLYSML